MPGKKGYIRKKEVVRFLHTLLSCVHDDKDFKRTLDVILEEKQNLLVNQKNIKSINGISLLGEGDLLIEGTGGGEPVEVDTAIDENSENPVQNQAIANALKTKQDSLVSGTNIKTINNQSVLGSGNLNVLSEADTALNDTSTNPVQNKVVSKAISDIDTRLKTIENKANIDLLFEISLEDGCMYVTDRSGIAPTFYINYEDGCLYADYGNG